MSIPLCNPSTFASLLLPISTSLLSLTTTPVTNFSASVPAITRLTAPAISYTGLSFCNVTLTYTHPGQNDSVIVETWLPASNATANTTAATSPWNFRLLAVGGGGWAAGRYDFPYYGMKGAIGEGYATITTDAGLGSATTSREWALLSEGNVDLYKLQNLMSVSLRDVGEIGKEVARSFYGEKPRYSYWNGCSQGGRQGMMLAQRYPGLFDGILAGAPGIYWSEAMGGFEWPQVVMNEMGRWPYSCEVVAISKAATTWCDGLDGVVDGIVGDVDGCLEGFDPFEMVGTEIECDNLGGRTVEITEAAAVVVNKTWHGRETVEGKRRWYGLTPGSDLIANGLGVAETNCTSGSCIGEPNALGKDWFELFIAKSSTFNIQNLTHKELDRFVQASKQEFGSMADTVDTDLSEFARQGSKMISWHGLVDQLLAPKATEKYYQDVSALLPNTSDFYRHFEIPGLEHCLNGSSGNPTELLAQLRAWVEEGVAPESSPVNVTRLNGQTEARVLCPYPKKATFDASCTTGECWVCEDAARPPLAL
ncbi:tannase and feruloyl esterase-domain-containing protein [Triangularia verruculosa]|uniref:Carboxylic ester hydrolase n=1 Tax=Triangularia verruculosa TaxID=2587418 RepID=A0AAN7AVY2_9PEZI|nr:tannase and feruloyl esterase-domain-containing protein [Triangularia verruculosa]